ncbi:MAG: DUF4907 domain-containing protein [Crocinitomicaceae bacterium]
MRIICLLLLLIIFTNCDSDTSSTLDSSINENPSKEEVVKPSQNNSEGYSFETFKDIETGWGYKILENGNMMINQPHIPSIQGNKGFSSQFKAAVAAQFIIEKLNKNIFPPSFSIDELDSLGLLD